MGESKDFKHNDRVKLSEVFQVHAHGNGFQLKRKDTTYSIIPIKQARETGFGQKIGWEVNKDTNRFDELHKAIEYVLEQEDVSVKVESIKEYYGIEEVDSE